MKIKRIICLLIIFNILTITFFPLIIYARESGAGGRPAPASTPSDSGKGSISSNSTPTVEKKEEVKETQETVETPAPITGDRTVYDDNHIYTTEYISGNVSEYLGEVPSLNKGEDSTTKSINVKNVTVELLRQNGNNLEYVDETLSDDNGNYYFRPYGAGRYYVRFKTGYIKDEFSDFSEMDIKNILKYNAQDYYIQKAPTGSLAINTVDPSIIVDKIEGKTTTESITTTTIETTQWEIKEAGKKASQVYIGLDCSVSMSETVDDNGTTRLEVASDAAKDLIHELLKSGQNIYIGLVFFKGNAYRAMGLTKNESYLDQCLEDIKYNAWNQDKWNAFLTDIYTALEKIEDSFIEGTTSDNSNKNIILVTDGNPTRFKNDYPYDDDSDEQYYETLRNKVYPPTIDKLTKIRSDGTKIMVVLVEPEDPRDKEDAHYIFDNYTDNIFTTSDDDLEETITTNVKKDIIIESMSTTTQDQEIISSVNVNSDYKDSSQEVTGFQETKRKEELEKNFSGMFVNNYSGDEDYKTVKTKLFTLIENYTKNDFEKAKELSDFAYNSYVARPYDLDGNSERDDGEIEVTGQDPPIDVKKSVTRVKYNKETKEYEEYTDYVHDYYIYTIHRNIYHILGYSNQNIILSKKPTTQNMLQIAGTGLRVTLPNGTVAYDNRVSSYGQDLTLLTDQYLIYSLDPELILGTVIDVEYTLRIQNPSAIQLNAIDIIAYIPDFLTYNPNLKPQGRTGDYEATYISKEDLESLGYIDNVDQMVSDGRLDKYQTDFDGIKISLKNDGRNEDGFYVSANNYYDIVFYASAKLTTLEHLNFNEPIRAEVLAYSNSANRRMALLKANENSSNSYFESIIPGTMDGNDYTSGEHLVSVVPVTGLANILQNVYDAREIVLYSFLVVSLIGATYIVYRINYRLKNR